MRPAVRRTLRHSVVVGLSAVLGISSGCGDTTGPPAPTSPNPPPASPANPPLVSQVMPARGTTGGGTPVTITGSGFQPGAVVTLAATRHTPIVENGTTVRVTTPPHDAGPVDIVVTNPDGRAVTVTGGYSYALPESFDFNGTWDGYALAHPDAQGRLAPRHSDMEMRITIENGTLTNAVCGGATMALLSPPSVRGGVFSHADDDHFLITGRIVSDVSAVGTIDTTACPATRWTAHRR